MKYFFVCFNMFLYFSPGTGLSSACFAVGTQWHRDVDWSVYVCVSACVCGPVLSAVMRQWHAGGLFYILLPLLQLIKDTEKHKRQSQQQCSDSCSVGRWICFLIVTDCVFLSLGCEKKDLYLTQWQAGVWGKSPAMCSCIMYVCVCVCACVGDGQIKSSEIKVMWPKQIVCL